jgi:hypothetical protein
MEPITPATRSLAVFETVRCLECGEVYSKPIGGGIVRTNPGCTTCGYLGWIPVTLPLEYAPLRSVEGRLPHRLAPAR